MDRVRIALVGYGSWGKRHYESWQNLPGAEVVGIYDPAYKGGIFHSSLASLLKVADAADIVVPAHSLTQTAITALESSKHIIVEKPMSTGVVEARELVKVADAYRSQAVMIGFIERFKMRLAKLILREEAPKEDIYTDEGLFQKSEDDSISDHEEAFMRGYCIYCD